MPSEVSAPTIEEVRTAFVDNGVPLYPFRPKRRWLDRSYHKWHIDWYDEMVKRANRYTKTAIECWETIAKCEGALASVAADIREFKEMSDKQIAEVEKSVAKQLTGIKGEWPRERIIARWGVKRTSCLRNIEYAYINTVFFLFWGILFDELSRTEGLDRLKFNGPVKRKFKDLIWRIEKQKLHTLCDWCHGDVTVIPIDVVKPIVKAYYIVQGEYKIDFGELFGIPGLYMDITVNKNESFKSIEQSVKACVDVVLTDAFVRFCRHKYRPPRI